MDSRLRGNDHGRAKSTAGHEHGAVPGDLPAGTGYFQSNDRWEGPLDCGPGLSGQRRRNDGRNMLRPYGGWIPAHAGMTEWG